MCVVLLGCQVAWSFRLLAVADMRTKRGAAQAAAAWVVLFEGLGVSLASCYAAARSKAMQQVVSHLAKGGELILDPPDTIGRFRFLRDEALADGVKADEAWFASVNALLQHLELPLVNLLHRFQANFGKPVDTRLRQNIQFWSGAISGAVCPQRPGTALPCQAQSRRAGGPAQPDIQAAGLKPPTT